MERPGGIPPDFPSGSSAFCLCGLSVTDCSALM